MLLVEDDVVGGAVVPACNNTSIQSKECKQYGSMHIHALKINVHTKL